MESGQRRRAGCGAPLWPCSERNTSRYSPAFHAELAATAGVEAREVFPCSDRTASDMCSPTISGECLPACSADWDNLTLRRGPRACPMASTHKIRRHRAARAWGLLAPKEQLAGLRLVSGRGNSLWRPAAQLSLRVGGNSEALRRARDGPWGEGGRWGGEGGGATEQAELVPEERRDEMPGCTPCSCDRPVESRSMGRACVESEVT